MPLPTHIKTNLLNNFALKIIALIIGYLIWFLISSHHIIQTTATVPVVFYNTTDIINSLKPESVTVTISAPRKELPAIISRLAVHIDATTLTHNSSSIAITAQNLFLPEDAKLIQSIPDNLIAYNTLMPEKTLYEEPNKTIEHLS